ncbi:hypothetical protein HU200_023303 [Digitaria exilis]|uniref:Uncharacterized protein n=1 Tax=Digitaria exilis TaxID=1010633 RepID=A0A835EYC2_9POAL|nr:hypothetical protein HU200_023303 [Digitaria exilis]
MAPSRKNHCAVLILLVIMASGGFHAEMASIGVYACQPRRPSGRFPVVCLPIVYDWPCHQICIEESSDNTGGYCDNFKCICCYNPHL